MDADAIGRYEETLVKYQRPVGHARQRRYHLLGSLVGGVLGGLGGPAGALAGATIGGLLAGTLSDKPGYRNATVSIDTSAVLQHGIDAIEQDVAKGIDQLFDELSRRYLEPVANYCREAKTIFASFHLETDAPPPMKR